MWSDDVPHETTHESMGGYASIKFWLAASKNMSKEDIPISSNMNLQSSHSEISTAHISQYWETNIAWRFYQNSSPLRFSYQYWWLSSCNYYYSYFHLHERHLNLISTTIFKALKSLTNTISLKCNLCLGNYKISMLQSRDWVHVTSRYTHSFDSWVIVRWSELPHDYQR